jgi:hypothetical protein
MCTEYCRAGVTQFYDVALGCLKNCGSISSGGSALSQVLGSTTPYVKCIC